ncbi:MAG: Rieske (2Fe-2S) protein [Halobacteriota archaeon]
MADHIVATADELNDGDRVVVEIEGRDVGVFRVDGEYYAYTNWCLHQAGPICEGSLSGTRGATFDPESLELELTWDRDGEILVCPWHGWEYDVVDGRCLSRRPAKLVSHPVRVEDGDVVVSL